VLTTGMPVFGDIGSLTAVLRSSNRFGDQNNSIWTNL
jgi:hypothetical protein